MNLDDFTDLEVLRVIGEESPEFVDVLASEIDRGRSDESIIRLVCDAGGTPKLMHYARKILRALRNLPADENTSYLPS